MPDAMEDRLKPLDAWCQVFVLGLWLLITVPFILPALLFTKFLAKIGRRLRCY
ncbi:hypothetical protein ES703_00111 [subsurface metagenome]